MKFVLFFISISLLFDGSVSANGTKTLEQTLVDDKIYSGFRLMYLHLAYLSHYMSKRSSAMMREQVSLLKYSQKIVNTSSDICKLLGFETERYLPNRTSCLDLKDDVISTNLETYKDLAKVEDNIKQSLDKVKYMLEVWKSIFQYGFYIYDSDNSKEKNSNIYRLLYNDFLLIFFDVARSIFEAYGIKYEKVKPEEVYAKQIYVEGLKTFVVKEYHIGLHGEPGVVQLARRANEANVDLIKRMLTDIATHLKECPPQIETLIKIFDYYKGTFESM